jgi:hypothetical protein
VIDVVDVLLGVVGVVALMFTISAEFRSGVLGTLLTVELGLLGSVLMLVALVTLGMKTERELLVGLGVGGV